MSASVWVISFVVFIAFLVFKSRRNKASSQQQVTPPTALAESVDTLTVPVESISRRSEFIVTIDGVEHDFSKDKLFLEVVPLMARNDWDSARRYLQKVAYGVSNGTEAEKEAFKIFMMGFASADPVYAQCVQSIQPILQEHPEGMRQTALYPHMAAAPDAETARYVLYYAELLGVVRRQKKGNSYTIFPVSNLGT